MNLGLLKFIPLYIGQLTLRAGIAHSTLSSKFAACLGKRASGQEGKRARGQAGKQANIMPGQIAPPPKSG